MKIKLLRILGGIALIFLSLGLPGKAAANDSSLQLYPGGDNSDGLSVNQTTNTVFYDQTFPFVYTGGPVCLSSQAEACSPAAVDDAVRIYVDGTQVYYQESYTQDFGPVDLSGKLFAGATNHIRVQLIDLMGPNEGGSALWLVPTGGGAPSSTGVQPAPTLVQSGGIGYGEDGNCGNARNDTVANMSNFCGGPSGIYLWSSPDENSPRLGALSEEDRLGDGVCNHGYKWFQVHTSDGGVAWVADSGGASCPVPNNSLPQTNTNSEDGNCGGAANVSWPTIEVNNGDLNLCADQNASDSSQLLVWSQPNMNSPLVAPPTTGQYDDPPLDSVCNQGYKWFLLGYGANSSGWVAAAGTGSCPYRSLYGTGQNNSAQPTPIQPFPTQPEQSSASPVGEALPGDGYEPGLSLLDQIGRLLAPPVVSANGPITSADCQKRFTKNNCTWYVAGIRPDVCQWIDPGQGNAYQWADQAEGKNAQALGIRVSKLPEKGDIAVWAPNCAGAKDAGHVAYVTGTSLDHNMMYIDEMNWGIDRTNKLVPIADSGCMSFISPAQSSGRTVAPQVDSGSGSCGWFAWLPWCSGK